MRNLLKQGTRDEGMDKNSGAKPRRQFQRVLKKKVIIKAPKAGYRYSRESRLLQTLPSIYLISSLAQMIQKQV